MASQLASAKELIRSKIEFIHPHNKGVAVTLKAACCSCAYERAAAAGSGLTSG